MSQLMDRILAKNIFIKYEGVIYDSKKKIFVPRFKTIFIPRSLKTTRNNPISPHNGPIKNCFLQTSYLSRASNETVQNSKSKTKEFSILCTLKWLENYKNCKGSHFTSP
jgi:hypothetical protein